MFIKLITVTLHCTSSRNCSLFTFWNMTYFDEDHRSSWKHCKNSTCWVHVNIFLKHSLPVSTRLHPLSPLGEPVLVNTLSASFIHVCWRISGNKWHRSVQAGWFSCHPANCFKAMNETKGITRAGNCLWVLAKKGHQVFFRNQKSNFKKRWKLAGASRNCQKVWCKSTGLTFLTNWSAGVAET